MEVKIIGEGNRVWPVLSRNRWGVYTLGNPSGGTRTVGEDRLTDLDGIPLSEKGKAVQNGGNQP